MLAIRTTSCPGSNAQAPIDPRARAATSAAGDDLVGDDLDDRAGLARERQAERRFVERRQMDRVLVIEHGRGTAIEALAVVGDDPAVLDHGPDPEVAQVVDERQVGAIARGDGAAIAEAVMPGRDEAACRTATAGATPPATTRRSRPSMCPWRRRSLGKMSSVTRHHASSISPPASSGSNRVEVLGTRALADLHEHPQRGLGQGLLGGRRLVVGADAGRRVGDQVASRQAGA